MSNEDTGAVTTTDEEDAPSAKCPVLSHSHTATGSMANQHWWPNQLNLKILNKNSPLIDPMGDDFDYAAEFESLDFEPLAGSFVDHKHRYFGDVEVMRCETAEGAVTLALPLERVRTALGLPELSEE